MDAHAQQRLIGQIAFKDFRENLLKDPENTLTAHGFPLDREVVAAIKQLTPELLDTLAKDVQKGFHQAAQ
jgi:hypothetical protein